MPKHHPLNLFSKLNISLQRTRTLFPVPIRLLLKIRICAKQRAYHWYPFYDKFARNDNSMKKLFGQWHKKQEIEWNRIGKNGLSLFFYIDWYRCITVLANLSSFHKNFSYFGFMRSLNQRSEPEISWLMNISARFN